MRKVFFIGASFFIYACGVSEGIKGAKGSKRQEGHEGHDNSDLSDSKEKPIYKDDTKKKTRERQGFYYLINSDECKFGLVNNAGSILLKRDVKDGNKRKLISYSCSRFAFVEDRGEVYVVLANEGVRRGAKAKNDEEMEIDFSDLYTEKSEYATIGKVPRDVWPKIREKLLEYNVTLNTYSSEDGLTVYIFRSNPTKEHKDKQKKFDKNYQNKSKANKNITLENDEYAKLFKILDKTFFITINGLYNNEDLEKCLQYMNEKILVDGLLLDKKIEEATCRAEILVKICKYLNCDLSFVSSICANGGYKELKKAFEKLTNVEFLKILKNLLDKKDKNNNEILNKNSLSSICNNKGFGDFENLVEMLSKSANLEEISKLSEHGIVFQNLSCICSRRGFSDFEKLVDYLGIPENLDKIEELKKNGIAFHNLSSICNVKGFNEFKELVEWFDDPINNKKLSKLEENGISFSSLSCICNGKGLQGLKSHLLVRYGVKINEEKNKGDSKENKEYVIKYSLKDTKSSKKESLLAKRKEKSCEGRNTMDSPFMLLEKKVGDNLCYARAAIYLLSSMDLSNVIIYGDNPNKLLGLISSMKQKNSNNSVYLYEELVYFANMFFGRHKNLQQDVNEFFNKLCSDKDFEELCDIWSYGVERKYLNSSENSIFEERCSINLTLPQKCSVKFEDLINNYFSEVKESGEEEARIETRESVCQVGDMLMFQINRHNSSTKKNRCYIKIPDNLIVPISVNEDNTNFIVDCFISHLGEEANSGHYVFVKVDKSGMFLYDDNKLMRFERDSEEFYVNLECYLKGAATFLLKRQENTLLNQDIIYENSIHDDSDSFIYEVNKFNFSDYKDINAGDGLFEFL